MLDEAVKRQPLRWTGHGPMAENRNAIIGNQPTMLAVTSEMLLLTTKIEVKNEKTKKKVS